MWSKVKPAPSLLPTNMGALRPGRNKMLCSKSHSLFHYWQIAGKNSLYSGDVMQWCSDTRGETPAVSDVLSLHCRNTSTEGCCEGSVYMHVWNLSGFSWGRFKVQSQAKIKWSTGGFTCHTAEIKSPPLNGNGKVEKSSWRDNSLNIWTVEREQKRRIETFPHPLRWR